MVMTILRSLIAIILAVLFFVLLHLYLGIYNTRVTLTDPDFYKGHLVKNDIYEKAYTVILPTLVKPDKVNKAVGFYGNLEQTVSLTEEDVEALSRQLFSRDFVQSNSERFIDEAFRYAKNESDTLDLTLDLRERKAAATKTLVDFVGKKYDALPTCTGGLAAELRELELLARGGRLPTCFPDTAARQAGLSRQLVKSAFLAVIEPEIRATVQREAPDTVDVVAEAAKSQDKTTEEFLSDFDTARKWIGFTLLWGLVIVIVLLMLMLLLLFLLHRRSLPAAMRWMGGTIFVSAVVPLIGLIRDKNEVPDAVQKHANLEAPVTEVVVSLTRSMTNDLFGNVIVQTSVITGLGFILIVASFFVRRAARSSGEESPSQAKGAD